MKQTDTISEQNTQVPFHAKITGFEMPREQIDVVGEEFVRLEEDCNSGVHWGRMTSKQDLSYVDEIPHVAYTCSDLYGL